MKSVGMALALALVWTQGVAAEGDAAAGKKVFKKCAACHAVKDGQKKVGPSMFGIWGRQAGVVEGYKYSKAMDQAGFIWDEDTLADFLAAPRKHLPGTKMAFAGLKKPDQIADVLAYLKSLQ
ncbi:MAG: cytochrome c family protein [Thalassovita sp.]